MYIRKKKNRSGTTSVVVVDKRKGIYREIITIGTSNNIYEIESFFQQGKNGYPIILGNRMYLRFMTGQSKRSRLPNICFQILKTSYSMEYN